jgi:predicted cytidylate kinase
MTSPIPPRHVTISGDLGSGKSSVAAELAGMLGYHVVSTGSLQREIASSLNMNTLEANLHAESDWSIDDRIDSMTVRVAREAAGGIVFDSRMAWHFVPGALRVRLTVDPYVAARRVIGRGPAAAEHYGSVDEAFDAIGERSASEGRRFQAIYGVDVARLANYDLILDTSVVGVAEAAVIIARVLDSPPTGRLCLVSPATVVPAFAAIAGAVPTIGSAAFLADFFGEARIDVVHARPFFLAVAGEDALAQALDAGDAIAPVRVVAEGEERAARGATASELIAQVGSSDRVRRWAQAHGTDLAGLRHYLLSRPDMRGSV